MQRSLFAQILDYNDIATTELIYLQLYYIFSSFYSNSNCLMLPWFFVFIQQLEVIKLICVTERKQLEFNITGLSQNQLWTIAGKAASNFWH